MSAHRQSIPEVAGFSRLSRAERVAWLTEHALAGDDATARALLATLHPDPEIQRAFTVLSENTVGAFHLPYGVVPNVLIDARRYVVPMVTEESSVVAAAAKSARFWGRRGGVRTVVVGTTKVGQVHFFWRGPSAQLQAWFARKRDTLWAATAPVTARMRARGGGLQSLELIDCTDRAPHYFQLQVHIETCDAMGANFVNSAVELLADALRQAVSDEPAFAGDSAEVDVVLAVLSNYTPQSVARAWVECPVDSLADPGSTVEPEAFAQRFCAAVRIAQLDVMRATTHNKGIFNGIDAVAIATGNDFRAIEAAGHAYAARGGHYSSLTRATVDDGHFHFEIELPMAVGTVGGLIGLHPMVSHSLAILGQPTAPDLMRIITAMGLLQNFAAIMALVTDGLRGHMRLHLSNMLARLAATPAQTEGAQRAFAERPVSFAAVRDFLAANREPR